VHSPTSGFARMVESAGAEARLGFKTHLLMLRHACGYALANRGHDTRALQAILGTRTFNTRCARPSCRRPGSRTSGASNDSQPRLLFNRKRTSRARPPCPLSAESCRGQVQQKSRYRRPAYSITSSAVASNNEGTVRPSALAVLRSITRSSVVDWCLNRL
jgi:hypothetical protein